MKVKSKIFTCPNQCNYLNKRGMSGIITTVIIIGIALAAIGIIWFIINTVVSEQVSSVENKSSKVFQSCKDAGYYKMEGSDACTGSVTYMEGEKCCVSGYQSITYGLISYWSFDVDARDDYGDNDGNVSGATWNATGGFNGKGSYEFDGDGDYINVIDDDSLDINSSESGLTISFWANIKNTSVSAYILSKGNNCYIRYQTSPFWQYDCGGFSNIGPLNKNVWTHIVISGNSSGISMYKNGTSMGFNEGDGFDFNNTSPLKIGDYASVRLVNGTIDEVRIYNRALSADEVRALYELE